MALKQITCRSKNDLIDHIKTHAPTFYYSSQTSTVIPYDKIEKMMPEITLCDLSQIKGEMAISKEGNLIVTGAVSWKEAGDFLKSHKRTIKTAPTEELALISAGVATSCTGERSFAFGNMRSQIVALKYINCEGGEIELRREQPFQTASSFYEAYQNDFKYYKNFKNAPYPRFETAVDLLTGTEGQMGVITQVEIETVIDEPVTHLFIKLPKWEVDYQAHLEIQKKIQAFRGSVILCELIDSNSLNYLSSEERPVSEADAIFFEVKSSTFDDFYEQFLSTLENINPEDIFELTNSKFHHIRASVPRAVFEKNSQMGVTKMGTDVQVTLDQFEDLLKIYQDFTRIGVNYNLFGHFGDAHLHFNFMPTTAQVQKCQEEFENMYKKIKKLHGSPFAEHGIGVIKQKFIKSFWNENQFGLFQDLKKEHDPYNQFFPMGFMSLQK